MANYSITTNDAPQCEMSRIDMLDALAHGFGIADPDAQCRNMDADAYLWRWLCDELVQAMSEDYARELIEFVARMNDIDLTNVTGE